jgi:muramoyltetrapeptide carboxypeptidase LdcA involved in peptidoglycan recycling
MAMPWLNNDELKEVAQQRFANLGLNLTFGKHIYEIDEFNSSSIESRIDDIHAAFADPTVKMLITVIGGFNSNQLLRYIDYDLIKRNPKIICGFSDITALLNAINAKTGMITYHGPHYFNFGDKLGFDYTLEYFKKCLMQMSPFQMSPSEKWSEDKWIGKQDSRKWEDNDGYWIINEGEAEGRIFGGNQCTFNLLHGTEFLPSFANTILFIEDDDMADPATFDRDLQSILHQPFSDGIKGIVIGRLQKNFGMTKSLLDHIIKSKRELKNVPVIANVDFGHTTPILTIPIGGTAKIRACGDNPKIEIVVH